MRITAKSRYIVRDYARKWGFPMVLLQIAGMVVGLGFLLTLIGSIKGQARDMLPGTKSQSVNITMPFTYCWALYSAAVAVAFAMSYGLAQLR